MGAKAPAADLPETTPRPRHFGSGARHGLVPQQCGIGAHIMIDGRRGGLRR